MKLKTFKNLNLKGKKVLLRVNFDVPIKNGKILDDSRIRAHLPTIFYLIKKKAKVILISHLDNPQKIKNISPRLTPASPSGRRLGREKQYSLEPIAEYINFRLKISAQGGSAAGGKDLRFKFINDCLGEKVEEEIEKLKAGEVILLENLRFYPEEQKNDKSFARKLASLADVYPVRSSSRDPRYMKPKGEAAFAALTNFKEEDLSQTSNGVYINDAFSVCHRAHASVSAITKYLPSYAGFLLEKEIKNLSQILEKTKHPFIVLMGGAKISTKLPVIKSLLKIADKVLIGGAIANNFLKAKRFNISQSIYEKGMVKEARKLIKNRKIVLPVDVRIKSKIKNKKSKISTLRSSATAEDGQIKNIKIEELNKLKIKDFKILDIGSETIELFADYLRSAKMIVWNGPMGYFEEKPFDRGTIELFKEIFSPCGGSTVGGKNRKAKIFIGGGDTIAVLKIKNQKSKIKNSVFISTSGGAMLEFLSGKILPGIRPLTI